jgi:hypothetical protein
MPSSGHSADLECWVATWREAGEALSAPQRDELERLDTATALAQLADAFEHACANAAVLDSSGLVEQQRYFQLLRR